MARGGNSGIQQKKETIPILSNKITGQIKLTCKLPFCSREITKAVVVVVVVVVVVLVLSVEIFSQSTTLTHQQRLLLLLFHKVTYL